MGEKELCGKRVESGGDETPGDERLHFRAEGEPSRRLRVVERLDAHAVAHEDEPAKAAVPEGDSEHAAQMAHELQPVLLVEVHDRLRIPVRAEAMPLGLEPRTKLAEVVDLAVEDRTDRAVLAHDRLMAAFDVDDREAPDPERGARPDPPASLIGAAMDDRRRHLRELRLVEGPARRVDRYESADSTHSV